MKDFESTLNSLKSFGDLLNLLDKTTPIKLLFKLSQKFLQIRNKITKELDALSRQGFDDPEDLSTVYVQPKCQHHNPADKDEREPRSAVRSPVFETLFDFFDDDDGDYHIRDGRTQMFILSDAGMGKTSLLLMLKLFHLIDFWPKDYRCELLKLGEDTLDKIKAIESPRNTLLLLDALDEDKTALGRIDARLQELLSHTTQFYRVILTCRTQFFPGTELDPFGQPGFVVASNFRSPMFFLSLFDNRQVNEYLDKRFAKRADIEQLKQRALKILGSMESLRFRPLLLAHIEDLTKPSKQHWNLYTVYEILMNTWLRRETQKIQRLHPDSENLPKHEDLRRACIWVADWMQRKSKRSINDNELQTLLKLDKNIAYLEEFNMGGRSLLNRNSLKELRFSHYTFQEFLLVYGLKTKYLKTQTRIRATDQMLRFLDAANYFQSALSKASFPNVNLIGRDLSYKNLQDADLQNSDLSNANLQYANLTRANLLGARLNNTKFDHAIFQETYGYPFQDKLLDGNLAPEVILLKGGFFLMGQEDIPDALPIHEVEIKGFAIGRYPVTFNEYDLFCIMTKRKILKDKGWGRKYRPVINISWKDAAAYCAWLSKQTNYEYRLPTEAEWEYACRAGSNTMYYFGDNEEKLSEYAWYLENAEGKTHPVGEKKPNVWGLYDMHGNIWEWTASVYAKKYKRQETQIANTNDVRSRAIRGGAWRYNYNFCYCAERASLTPGLSNIDCGFRVLRKIKARVG